GVEEEVHPHRGAAHRARGEPVDAQQPPHLDVEAELLEHLPLGALPGVLARIDAAAGQQPVVAVVRLLDHQVVVLVAQDHRTGGTGYGLVGWLHGPKTTGGPEAGTWPAPGIIGSLGSDPEPEGAGNGSPSSSTPTRSESGRTVQQPVSSRSRAEVPMRASRGPACTGTSSSVGGRPVPAAASGTGVGTASSPRSGPTSSTSPAPSGAGPSPEQVSRDSEPSTGPASPVPCRPPRTASTRRSPS